MTEVGVGTCDLTVYQEGLCILIIGGVTAKDMEEWIKLLRTKVDLGADELDWHYAGGRAIVKVLDFDPPEGPEIKLKLQAAIKELTPQLSAFMAKDARKYGCEPRLGAVFAQGGSGFDDLCHPATPNA